MKLKSLLPYDTFNARSLTYEEVASSFVENLQYSELTNNNHTLLMGPRGSGKTTLLKMLSPIGQYYWLDKKIQNYNLPFFGIYIYSDVLWKQQNDALAVQLKDYPTQLKVILRQLVLCDCLSSVLQSFEGLCQFYYQGDKTTFEYDLCKTLVDIWNISKPVSPTFYSLQQKIDLRVAKIGNDVNKLTAGIINIDEVVKEDYFYDDYFKLTELACRAFNRLAISDAFFKEARQSWALCFDELEIAPEWLQIDLLQKLKSSAQIILLKLTTGPLVSLKEKVDAMEGQDFKVVRTWSWNSNYANKWITFSKKITQKLIQKRLNSKFTPEQIFGNSGFHLNLEWSFESPEGIKKYAKNSSEWQMFREYALIDTSFKNYLVNKGVNPMDPQPETLHQKNTIFRKIKPVVLFRYQYGIQGRRRSRKNPALYYGLPYIYEMCDGNPRALIGIVEEMLQLINPEKEKLKPISIKDQSRLIELVSQRQLELIVSHPEANRVDKHDRIINLGNIIRLIGKSFRSKLYDGSFVEEPSNKFRADKTLNADVAELIEFGVQLGALIYTNPIETVTKNGIMDKKFRLAFILHPSFKLPQREWGDLALSEMLQKRDSARTLQTELYFDVN